MSARLAIVAASLAVLAGCAVRQQVRAAQSEYAVPARNPVARATAQEPIEQNPIDATSMKVAVFDVRPGYVWTGWEWRAIVSPALSPADALEVRRAFEACLWKPPVGPDGQPGQASITLAIQRREPSTPAPSP